MGKSKIKPFIIAGVIILIIGLIIGIYFYVTTDFLKSAKTLFTKYFTQTLSLMEPDGIDADKNLQTYTDNNNYKEVGTLTFDFVNGLGNAAYNRTEYVIKSELQKDVSNNKVMIPISLNFRNQELLSRKYINSK